MWGPSTLLLPGVCRVPSVSHPPQDILENESITLDWMFRYSLTNDIVKVGPEEPMGGSRENSTCFWTWLKFHCASPNFPGNAIST